jgi:hypothetical protein
MRDEDRNLPISPITGMFGARHSVPNFDSLLPFDWEKSESSVPH